MEIAEEFERLLDRDWREAAVYGSRYSLKSGTVARILLIRTRQEKIRVGCFREFQNSIAESSHQLLKDLIEYYELTDFEITDNAIVNTVNGSEFIFKGLHRNEQSIKSIEGIDIAWVEEAQTVSVKSLETLTPTIRKPGSQIIYTYNRLTEEDPIHKRLVIEGRPNTLVIKVDYTVAKKYGFLPKQIEEEIEDDKKRPNLFKHKWLGEPENQIEGKVYNDWKEIEEIPFEARLERYGLDFGYWPDPCAIVQILYYNGGYILDELLYERKLENPHIASTLLNLPKALVIADSAEPKSIAEIRRLGVNIIGADKGSESVRYGVKTVQAQKISVTKRSVNLLKEYRGYLQAVDKNTNLPLVGEYTGENHLLDAVRYAICSLLPIKQRKEKLAQIIRLPNTPRVNVT